jgi:hypothetical protein
MARRLSSALESGPKPGAAAMNTSMARPVRWAEQMVRDTPWQLLSRAQRAASAAGSRKPEKMVRARGSRTTPAALASATIRR